MIAFHATDDDLLKLARSFPTTLGISRENAAQSGLGVSFAGRSLGGPVVSTLRQKGIGARTKLPAAILAKSSRPAWNQKTDAAEGEPTACTRLLPQCAGGENHVGPSYAGALESIDLVIVRAKRLFSARGPLTPLTSADELHKALQH